MFQSKYDKPLRVRQTFGESMTIQDHKDECDINSIVKRGMKTGFLIDPTKPRREAMFGDFTSGNDFEEAQQSIANVKNDFMELPSNVREAFNNDPKQLLDALTDEGQRDKLIELGVLQAIQEKADIAKEIGAAVAEAIKEEEADETTA